jgi:hypothetical protein
MVYLGRITAQEGSEEFDRQYWEIVSGKRFEAKTSWSALICAMKELALDLKKVCTKYIAMKEATSSRANHLNDLIQTQRCLASFVIVMR